MSKLHGGKNYQYQGPLFATWRPVCYQSGLSDLEEAEKNYVLVGPLVKELVCKTYGTY